MHAALDYLKRAPNERRFLDKALTPNNAAGAQEGVRDRRGHRLAEGRRDGLQALDDDDEELRFRAIRSS